MVRNYSSRLSLRFASTALEMMKISVISEAELLFGLERRPEAHVLAISVHALLRKIAILPWTSAAAEYYATVRADLERTGQPMDDMDIMIAAHVLAEDCVLVTNDAAFRRIEGLKIEDWTAG
ncbi:PIN domain-containing protein [Acidipila sp. 4G-K13]|nr:PIN domain-containing protein [Paracidobacterium acidisoli]